MKKMDELAAMARAAGDEATLNFLKAVQMYAKNLHKRCLDKFLLDLDIASFRAQLLDSGLIDMIKGNAAKIEIFIDDVLYISRHIWEGKGANGEMKNGDDLHQAYPARFPQEGMMTVEDTYRMLPFLQSVSDRYC